MTTDTMIGVDLAKNVFQIHGASMSGHVQFRKKLSRTQFSRFMGTQQACVVVMEACGSAHYWAREMRKSGHEVKLIAPHYVTPFVKRHKNDAADAEAIVEAAQRPQMRFVQPKTPDQQARVILFRARELLVRQRTQLINSLRSHLYEFGYVVPQGTRQLAVIADIVDDPNTELPAMVRGISRSLLDQINDKTTRINALLAEIREDAAQVEAARRLQTMPGIGPITALAVEAFAPPMESFRCGRDFAAWLGLVPKTAFFRRQAPPWPCVEGRTGRYSTIVDHWGHVTAELDGAKNHPRGVVACATCCTQTAQARGGGPC